LIVVDDHLLRDVLSDDVAPSLAGLLAEHEAATTNLFHVRLCRSAVAARGGALTGGWSEEARSELARSLVVLPESIRVMPMTSLAFRMAELARDHRVSTLGAEAVAAAEHLGAVLCVWEGDDGPAIRAAAGAVGVAYHALGR
jgi:hypothetical protein